jgi:hypothetical protein
MKKRDYYETPKSTAIQRFLWNAAGGDRYLLERATYSDQVKYMCLGGIVFSTGAMAALAGGYGFYTIFSPKSSEVLDSMRETGEKLGESTDIPTAILASIFGIIWGLIIFNIDRFIVTSTGKGDGTEAITWDELKGAIPRILMGAIIALTISKPVEIRMFKTEIDLAIHKKQEQEKEMAIDQANANYTKKVNETNQKLGRIKDEIESKTQSALQLRKEISDEITGKNNNGANYGPRAKELERQASILEADIERMKNTDEYKNAMADIRKFETDKNKEMELAIKQAATLDGLLIRIQLAHEIAGFWISLFITLLFMAIELTPVFFKLMLVKTPYDYLAENRDDLIRAENGIEIKFDYYKDKTGVERHLTIHHEAERMIYEKIKLTQVQKELTDYAVDKYKDQEKAKIDNNLDQFIKNENDQEAS